MTSDIPETKNTPYTTPDEWSLFAATVWTVVELTVPPPTQDASHITNSQAVKPKETETLHITSAVKGIGPEEAKRQTEGMSTAKTKENRQVDSIEAKSSLLGLSKPNSCHASEGNQTPDLSQCHVYNDNSQAFAEWKGSSQPSCPKWGPPPYLGGHPTGSSGLESQNKPSDATASTERSRGQGPNVPPFN
ncbi:hypothetical protein SLS64_000730 [Diaporthe eres]